MLHWIKANFHKWCMLWRWIIMIINIRHLSYRATRRIMGWKSYRDKRNLRNTIEQKSNVVPTPWDKINPHTFQKLWTYDSFIYNNLSLGCCADGCRTYTGVLADCRMHYQLRHDDIHIKELHLQCNHGKISGIYSVVEYCKIVLIV